ncbi:MAG: PorP/SprF family type IX secretion system membrane protein [Bacteroidales bacterium]|nr:PorP/SprF family type IX secretion system membrane protein [Bacteroidales bacterium]
MKKILFFWLCFAGMSCALFGQNIGQADAQFTLFPWASSYYNPGAAGEQNNTICFTGFFRQEYMGYKDQNGSQTGETSETSTTTSNSSSSSSTDKGSKYSDGQQFLANLDFYSRKIHGALTLSFLKDAVNRSSGLPHDNIGVRLGYAFKMNAGPGKLGIGAHVAFVNNAVDKSKMSLEVAEDPLVNEITESMMNLDFNVGAFYKTETWYAGVSLSHVLGPEAPITLSGNTYLEPGRHLYVHGGYKWILPWFPSWVIEPQALFKLNTPSAFGFDVMVLARYNGILWTGMSYRYQGGMNIMFGARPFFNSSNNYLKGIDIGVAYDFPLTRIGRYKQGYSGGNVEVMIRYCFDIYRQETYSGYGNNRYIYKNQY